MDRIFKPKGILKNYEYRPEQEQMAVKAGLKFALPF
jgi:hypothetical protein